MSMNDYRAIHFSFICVFVFVKVLGLLSELDGEVDLSMHCLRPKMFSSKLRVMLQQKYVIFNGLGLTFVSLISFNYCSLVIFKRLQPSPLVGFTLALWVILSL